MTAMPLPNIQARPSSVAFGEDDLSFFLSFDSDSSPADFCSGDDPDELKKLLDENRGNLSIHQVVLGPAGEWFLNYDDQDRSTFWGNVSDLFVAALHATKDTDGKMQISWVAFGPQESFFVQRVEGEPFWHGLPKDLEDLVAKSPREVKHLTLGRPTGWCVFFNDGACKWSLPSEYEFPESLRSLEASTLKHVCLGNSGNFILETTQRTYFKATGNLEFLLWLSCNRSLQKEKVKTALADSPILSRTHAALMTVLTRMLEEHREGSYIDQLLEDIKSKLLFDPKFTRLYSFSPACYGQRGGHPYFKPCGWRRCSLAIGNFEEYSGRCIAYHGTSCLNVASIMLRGLRRPGDEGVSVAHGQAHSKSRCSIYVTPSIEYAAFPVYATFFEIQLLKHWAQLVLECRVRPGSFVVKPGSLGNKYWPEHLRMDSNFETNSELEWLIESPDDVVFTGLMIREFGEPASEEIYGSLVRQVTWGSKGPQFEWTKLRAAEYERLQYCI